METDLLRMFDRFANYLEKNNSSICVKIENDNIMIMDKTIGFDNKFDDTNYIRWFITVEKIPLETQINCFFFGRNYEVAKNLNISLICSIFEYCNMYLIDKSQMAPFGIPKTIEELAMKMDLMGI